MKITDVETILLTVPSTWEWGTRPSTHGFVRVRTDSGLTGLGEAYVAWYMPEVIPPMVKHFADVVVGKDPFEIHSRWREMFVKTMRWGHVGPSISALGAIDIALWDILGKSLGTPVYQLLGGLAHRRLRCYTSLGEPDEAAVAKLRANGYTAVKIAHTGGMVQERPLALAALIRQETQKTERMREVLGDDIDLILDPALTFNRAPWSRDTALKVVQALEPYHLLWMEQPALQTNIEDYLWIRRHTSTPLAAGENGTTLHDYKPFFENHAIDIVQPDASWCGGISECVKIHAAAEAHDMRTVTHSFSGAAGLAANYHVAFASRNCFMVRYPVRDDPLAKGLVSNAFTFKDGHIQPTGAPGLGVELPDELVEKYPFVPDSGIAHGRSPFPRPTPDWTPTKQDVTSW